MSRRKQQELMANGRKMDLSQIKDGDDAAEIDRNDVVIDGKSNIHIQIAFNLKNGTKWHHPGGFYLNEDATILKSGTAVQKAALRRKYLRLAVEAYLNETKPAPSITPQGKTAVNKTAFQEEGDTL